MQPVERLSQDDILREEYTALECADERGRMIILAACVLRRAGDDLYSQSDKIRNDANDFIMTDNGALGFWSRIAAMASRERTAAGHIAELRKEAVRAWMRTQKRLSKVS